MTRSLLPEGAVVQLRDGDLYRVLSVRQPWAWAIIHAGKDVENRPRASNYRGPLLIHASGAKATAADIEDLRRFVAELHGPALDIPESFPTGELIGLVELADCQVRARSPWAARGAKHLILRHPCAVPADIKLHGQLGIWYWTVGTENVGWARKDASTGGETKPKRARPARQAPLGESPRQPKPRARAAAKARFPARSPMQLDWIMR